MPNALATPPAAPQDGADSMAAMPTAGNPLQGPMVQGQGAAPPQQQQQQPPAPTHGQTVAALRHFDAIERQLEPLLKDEKLGRSNMKSAIIDAVTKLVAGRIMTPATAVMQLGTVPDDPLQQRKWVMQHDQQARAAKDSVLDHHRTAFAGAPEEMIAAQGQSSPDDHMDTMSGLMAHYGKR